MHLGLKTGFIQQVLYTGTKYLSGMAIMAFYAAPGADSPRADSRHVTSAAGCAGQALQVACAWPQQVLGCQPCGRRLLLLQHLGLQGSLL